MRQRIRQQQGYIYKRGGWWWLRWREWAVIDGKARRVHRAKRLASIDAQHRSRVSVQPDAEAALRPLNENRYPPESVTTMGDFAERVYFPHCEEQKRASTFRDYRNRWAEYLERRCADWWLREVRTCNVQALLQDIARGHDLSSTTLRHVKALVSAIFTYAKQMGYYDGINPVQGVSIPKARPAGETYAYTLEEIQQMLLLLLEPARTAVATAAFTGLRRSEIQGLYWTDYSGREVRISRSIWCGIENEPKTRKSKAPVPIIGPLAKILEVHRLRCGEPQNGPIFANGNHRPLCLNNLANRTIVPSLQWCKVCAKRRTEHEKVEHLFELDHSRVLWHGWHAFRRGLATNLYRLGVPDKTIQAILRHANLSTTMNVYVKSVDEDSVKAMQALEATVDKSLLCANCAPNPLESTPVRPS